MTMRQKNRFLRRSDVQKLIDAYRAARLEQCAVNPEAQRDMKCYLDSWVAHPLRSVLFRIGFTDEEL